MKPLCAATLLILLLPVPSPSQDQGDAVYGTFRSSLIRMVHLRADKTFLMIQGTEERRGTYTKPAADKVVLLDTDGQQTTCQLQRNTLTVQGRELPLWKGGTTAASFLGSNARDVVVTVENKAKVHESLLSLSCMARQYRERTGSYLNFTLPAEFAEKNYASYELDVSPVSMKVTATSLKVDGAITVTIGEDGKPTDWVYQGEFK